VEDALAAADAGADAVGFVFAESSRRVVPGQARAIVDRLPPFVVPVGVFADMPISGILDAVAESGVRMVQLHGTESAEIRERMPCPVIQRIDVSNPPDAERAWERLRNLTASAVLLDPGYGAGRSFDWSLAADLQSRMSADRRVPLILAGGLNAGNVGEAIRRVRPYAVDVCSGVESKPGRKDAGKLKAFVDAVREADERDLA
jgi:phosphoribosylanthranilate isomerase